MGAVVQAREHADSKVDTLDSKIVPIVFVPGVMGSRIDLRGAASDWDPDDTAEMAGWLAVTRRGVMKDLNFANGGTLMQTLDDPIGTDPMRDILQNKRLATLALPFLGKGSGRSGTFHGPAEHKKHWERRGWGQVVWSFYGTLLIELEDQLNPAPGGELHPVHAVGYDWRQGNRDSALHLDQRLTEILKAHAGASKVIMVTHSMGGLVTRALLAQKGESRIAGVLHCVMPADGAAVAYRRCLTGARREFDDGREVKPDGTVKDNAPFRGIIGDARLPYALTQSVLRGPTELLPHNSYAADFLRMANGVTNKFFSDICAEYSRDIPPGIVPRVNEVDEDVTPDLKVTTNDIANLRARLSEARAFASLIAGKAHPNTFLMAGDGQRTDVAFNWTTGTATANGADMLPMVVKSNAGDGTVPKVSADFPALTSPISRDSFSVEHASCFAGPKNNPGSGAAFRKEVLLRVNRLLARA